jgi:hypothetical protein
MTKKAIGKNSKLNKNSRQETLQKDRIKKSIENTGFFVVITNNEHNIEKLEKR